jgi:hypothetical protein
MGQLVRDLVLSDEESTEIRGIPMGWPSISEIKMS